METTEQENNRNPDGTFKQGYSGNPGGRPKGSLKSYLAKKLAEMSEEEKEEYLKDINKELAWRMAEGNPDQKNEHEGNITVDISEHIAKKRGIHDTSQSTD